MLDNVNGIIFDLDGTLIDSMWMWYEIDVEFLRRFHFACPNDLQKQIEGMSFDETADYFIRRFQIPMTRAEIQTEWNCMAWEKYAKQVPLKKGVLPFLDYLRDRQIPCGIASSNSKELIDLVIKTHDIREYFDSIRNSNEVKKGKPSPDIYLLVAKDLGIKPAECLVFEDVFMGVKGGKNAGMKVCNVYDDYSKNDRETIFLEADFHITDYEEILNGTYLRL